MGVTISPSYLVFGVPKEMPYAPGFAFSTDTQGFMLAQGMGGIWCVESIPENKPTNMAPHTKLTRTDDDAAANRHFSPPTVAHTPFMMRGDNAELFIFKH